MYLISSIFIFSPTLNDKSLISSIILFPEGNFNDNKSSVVGTFDWKAISAIEFESFKNNSFFPTKSVSELI